MEIKEKDFLFYFPGCETNIIQTAQGKRLIIKCTRNKNIAERFAAVALGVSSDGISWSFPLNDDVRGFLAGLPENAKKPASRELFRHILKNDELFRQYPDGRLIPEKTLSPESRQKLTDMIRLREIARDICAALLRDDEREVVSLRESCLPLWREFTTTYGPLKDWSNRRLMQRDPEWGVLRGLGDGLVPGHLLRGESLQPAPPAGPTPAFLLTVNPSPTLSDAAKALKLSQDKTSELLKSWKLERDMHGQYRPRVEIVSQTPGELAFAHGDETLSHGYTPSIFDDLAIRPGLPWIGADNHEYWLRYRFPGASIHVAYFPETGTWHCELPETVRSFTGDWGYAIPHLGFGRLFDDIMACRSTIVMTGGEPDEECMRLADTARKCIIRDFREDMKSLGLAEEIVRRHDAFFPAGDIPVWEDLCLSLPGCRFAPKNLYPHQRRAIRRLLTSEAVFLHHEVGAGKTRIEGIAAMEWRRLGMVRRTLMTVPSAIIEQMHNDLLDMYPFARVFRFDAGDIHPRNAAVITASIRGFDPDVILVSHETFARLRAPDAWLLREEKKYREREHAFSLHWKEKGVRPPLLLSQRPASSSTRKEERLDITCLDCDALIVDEAHLYKHATTRRGQALEEISGWLRHGHGRIVLASGTPLANDPMELYRMQRYLQREELERRGIFSAAAWRKTFLEPVRTPEPSPDGMGYRYRMRWRFMASGDIRRFFGQVEDRVRLDDCKYITRPEVQTFTHMCKSSLAQREMFREIAREIVMGAHILPLIGKGRLLSLCPPLLGLPLPSKGKIASAAMKIAEMYHADHGAGQLVFMDMGVPRGTDLRAYGILMNILVERGVAREDVTYVQAAKTKHDREMLFRRFREGNIRILIGSTQTMGEGANLQTRLAAIHHLDCPWRPKDFEQRVGRGKRQGNTYQEVENHVWFTEDSLDGFVAAVNNRKYHDFIRDFYAGTDSDEMLSRMLYCRGDMSRQMTLCHGIEFWPERLEPLLMENEEFHHWKKIFLRAADMVYLLTQDYWRTNKGHIYPARCWPSIIAMEVEQVSLEGLGKKYIRNGNIDDVPLFVLACGMENKDETLDRLMGYSQSFDAGKSIDLSFFRRDEDISRTLARLEGKMTFNVREEARRLDAVSRLKSRILQNE